MIKAIIFDLDGTLLDSFEVVYETWMRFFEKVGLKKIGREEFRNHYDTDWLKWGEVYLQKDFSKGTKENILWLDINNELSTQLKLFPGIKDFLKGLKEKNYKIGLVTAANRGRVEKELKKFGIMNFFDLIIAYEDVPVVKPDPRSLIIAARRLGVSPNECIYVGDMEGDVLAARNAGMFAVSVNWGYQGKVKLRSIGAQPIAHSVYELNYLLKNVGE